MEKYKEIKRALIEYTKALAYLRKLVVTTNKKDFTSQIGEWFVSELYNGKRAESAVQKYWDIKIDGKYVQVKSHSKAETTKARWSQIKYDENATIDELIIVIFTSDYKLKEFYVTPWSVALKHIKRQKGRDVIYWDDLKKYQKMGKDLPNMELVSLFR